MLNDLATPAIGCAHQQGNRALHIEAMRNALSCRRAAAIKGWSEKLGAAARMRAAS
jgi:hypothetical protein